MPDRLRVGTGWARLLAFTLVSWCVASSSCVGRARIDPAHVSTDSNGLCYIEASVEDGWYAQDIANTKDFEALLDRHSTHQSLIIPIFPTVYSPGEYFDDDAAYYNYILKESAIRNGDRVLVIGSGSGADTWVAWLKSRSEVTAIDINPLAVANTKATARLADVPVNAIQGDIRTMPLSQGFGGFDHVLWNMPFLDTGDYKQADFHDHERGDVLDALLARLPRLLKPDGEAILLNTEEALRRIHAPEIKAVKTGRKSTSGSDVYLVVIRLR